jgi:hypothetical protein
MDSKDKKSILSKKGKKSNASVETINALIRKAQDNYNSYKSMVMINGEQKTENNYLLKRIKKLEKIIEDKTAENARLLQLLEEVADESVLEANRKRFRPTESDDEEECEEEKEEEGYEIELCQPVRIEDIEEEEESEEEESDEEESDEHTCSSKSRSSGCYSSCKKTRKRDEEEEE